MSKLVVSIPNFGLSAKADDSRQLYVLAFVSDLNIAKNHDAEIIGAANKNLATLAPELAGSDGMKFLLASVSNIFQVSRSFPKASLSGSGIMLYPNLDPKGFFALQMFVIESDDNHRKFGEKLAMILGNSEVKAAIDLLKTNISNPLIGGLMSAVSSVVPSLFKDSSDDLLMAHAHSGFDFDNYGVPEDKKSEDFIFASKLVEGTLRVRVTG